MYIYSRGLVSVLGIFAVVLSSSLKAEEKQILLSVVRVQVITPNGTLRGTGFAVEGGVVTAAHIVEKSNEVDILCGDGDDTIALSGEVIRRDALLDMALIRVKNDFDKVIDLPPVKFDTSFPVNPGIPVYAIGNSLGFTRSISAGIVSASGKKSGERFLYSDVLTRKGNSGGPLVNSKGEVIAITLGTIDFSVIGEAKTKDSNPEFTYCVPAADIVEFLEAHKTNRKNNAFVGVLGKSVATGLDHPGLEQALQITRTVRPCGLQAGDMVYLLADQPITSQRDMVRVVRTLQPGTFVKADILRNGQFKSVEVSVVENNDL
jgi:serine protease Do